jgi:transposase
LEDARQEREQVTLSVDTHAELHVAAALDERDRLLGTCTIPTTTAGYAELVRWTSQYADLAQVGIEGTGSYGAGLARWLGARNVTVVEVDRPDPRTRRRRGKSDSVDAEAEPPVDSVVCDRLWQATLWAGALGWKRWPF